MSFYLIFSGFFWFFRLPVVCRLLVVLASTMKATAAAAMAARSDREAENRSSSRQPKRDSPGRERCAETFRGHSLARLDLTRSVAPGSLHTPRRPVKRAILQLQRVTERRHKILARPLRLKAFARWFLFTLQF